jgi:beta-lactam-binding protein with PASTA domain
MRARISSHMSRRGFSSIAGQAGLGICLGLAVLILSVLPTSSRGVQSVTPQQKKAPSKDSNEKLEVAFQTQKVAGLALAQLAATVPNLRGQTPKQAITTLRQARLVLGEVHYGIYDVPAGQVARQYPQSRENVPAGSAVEVWVARETPPGQLSTEVPDLHGRTLDEARRILRRAHLLLGEIQYGNFDVQAGRVAKQHPPPRENAPVGSTVAVWVAREPSSEPLTATVPDLRGRTVDEAAAILRSAHLVPGEVYPGNYDAAPGRVARQYPQPHESVSIDTAVAVWVARGPDLAPPPPEQPSKRRPGRQPGRQPDSDLVTVPDLRSRQEVAAKMILEQRGLRYGGAKEIISDQQTPGTILDQQPKPDTLVRRGTAIRVVIAVGPPPEPTVEVPNLVQKKKEEAQQELQSVGLQSSDSEIREVDSEEETGMVVSQVPPAGTRVKLGTRVSFDISRQIAHSFILRLRPTNATPGEPVTFTAELDPPFPGATFQFTFGEGVRSEELDAPEVTHQYTDDGDYVAFATATLGGRQVISNRVEIPVHLARLDIRLLFTPVHARANETIQFHAAVTPSSQAGNAVYNFHFGDNTTDQTSSYPDVQHSYRQSDQYSAWVTVRTVHEPLPGSASVHEHFYTSDPIQVVIAPPLVFTWGIVGAILGAVLLAGAGGFLFYRWIQMQRLSFQVKKDAGIQWPERSEDPIASIRWQFRTVHSAGEQKIACRGSFIDKIIKS